MNSVNFTQYAYTGLKMRVLDCFATKTYVEGSFEQPKQMLNLMDKEIFTIFFPLWTYDKRAAQANTLLPILPD